MKWWKSHESNDQSVFTDEMRLAYRLLRGMTEEERGFVLCWFCAGCRRYIGPGESCHCENDE